MGLFRKTLNSCFGIFWEIAGKKSHMGKNFLRLWTKRENYNGNFWENMGLFRKTMKSCFGIFWEKLGKYSHNGKIFLFSGKQNPTIWENMGISWTRFRSKFARFWEILGKCRKIWGYFGKIWDYFFPKKLLFLTVYTAPFMCVFHFTQWNPVFCILYIYTVKNSNFFGKK